MEIVTARLAVELAELGHDVDVVCLEEAGPAADILATAGVAASVVPTPGLRTNLVPAHLADRFASRMPDVVHSHSGVWLKAVRAAQMAGLPAVHTAHGLMTVEPWYHRYIMRLAAAMTPRIVAVSQPMRDYLMETVGIAGTKIDVVPNGVDTQVFSPRRVVRDDTIGRRIPGPVVGCVARFDPVKNHELLLDAFSLVRRQHANATLVLVGEGELRARLEQRAAQPDLAGSVVFLGDRRDTPDVYRSFDIFVLTSTSEGTSMSILEAMATGCCIVATDVGGTGALLDQGAAGVLVPSRDITTLASQLGAMLTDDNRRVRLGELARARAMNTYSQRSMALQYVAIYRDVIARSRRSRAASLAQRGT